MINEKVKNHTVFTYLLIFSLLLVGFGEAATIKLRVKVSRANIRSGPGTENPVISIVSLGIMLDAEKIEGNWYKVYFPRRSDGEILSGYIHNSTVEVFEKMDIVIQPEEEIKKEQAEKIDETKKIEEIIEPVKEETPREIHFQELDIVGKGKLEISTAASFNRNKISFEDHSDTITTFSIPVRLGYFLTNNIEIETELMYSYLSQTDATATTLLLLANVAYNFRISSRFRPFVLVGSGINRISADLNGITESQTNMAFNGGGGIKWFASRSTALRLEYRLLYYLRNDAELDLKMNFLIHKVFLGISIFF